MVDRYNFKIVVSGEGVEPAPLDFYNDELVPITSVPTFSPPAGTYSGTQNVTISSDLEGASIYYTTDGSTPTIESTLYTGPVTVSTNLSIKAIAVLAGYGQSAVATAAYVLYTETFEDLDDWDTTGTVSVGDDGLITSVGAGENNYARSKWYLTGDFEIQAFVSISDRAPVGKYLWARMILARESDNQCFAELRNQWNSAFPTQWRGWDSCSGTTHMGEAGTAHSGIEAIARIVRVGNHIYTYVKHDQQAGWPNPSSWIAVGDDNSFFSGVPGNTDCNVVLGGLSAGVDTPTGSIIWRYLDVVSGTIVTP